MILTELASNVVPHPKTVFNVSPALGRTPPARRGHRRAHHGHVGVRFVLVRSSSRGL